jgi:hypothetical protein
LLVAYWSLSSERRDAGSSCANAPTEKISDMSHCRRAQLRAAFDSHHRPARLE